LGFHSRLVDGLDLNGRTRARAILIHGG
jgi:hypothetical protein